MQKLTTLGKVFDRVDEMSAGCYDQNIDVPDISLSITWMCCALLVNLIRSGPWHSDRFQNALAFRIRICAVVHLMCRR